MRTVPDFNSLINNKKLEEIKVRVSEINKMTEDEAKEQQFNEIVKEVQTDYNVGLPSDIWFSDHIPVGAVFSWQ